MQFFGDVDGLGAVVDALAASDAMVCLAEAGHAPIIANEESAASLTVILVQLVLGDVPFIDTFIIM